MKTRQTSFAITGMRGACAKCAVTIEHALARVDGVIASNVNYATEHATVLFDPTRVSVAQIVQAVRREGFDVSQQHIGFYADGLMYVSSVRTIARVLEQADGVVHASVDLKAQRIALDVLAEHENRPEYERAIANLGLRVVEQLAPDPTREFAVRLFFIIALTLLSLWSAGAHAGWLEASVLHVPLVVIAISVVIGYGIAWRFYRAAFDTCLHGEFDFGVLVALVASISLVIGLPFALVSATSMFTTSGFILAILLTAGWFVARGVELWNSSRINHPTIDHSPATQAALGIISNGSRH